MELHDRERQQQNTKELKEAFLLFDTDGDGLIDAEDLQKGLNLTGNRISNDMAKIMLEFAGTPSGKMSFEDFKRVILVTTSPTPSSP